MPPLTERDKVRLVVRRLIDDLEGNLIHDSNGSTVGRITIDRRGYGSELGRPDAVVVIELNLDVLGVPVRVRTPVLVEVEDSGLEAARDDWDLFFDRDELEIPMVVVGPAHARRKETNWVARARVNGEVQFVGFDEPRPQNLD